MVCGQIPRSATNGNHVYKKACPDRNSIGGIFDTQFDADRPQNQVETPKLRVSFRRAAWVKPIRDCYLIRAKHIVNNVNQGLVTDVESVREVLSQHGRLSVDVAALDPESDLYGVGLTSLATVGIMLALEDRFDIEFPESMLSRKTFKSLAAIAEAVASLAS